MKWILIALVILTLALVACSASDSTQEEVSNTINLGDSSPDDSDILSEPVIISTEELATHNSADSCWVVYDNEVYDITDYVPKHPGGANQIIPHCGTSEEFVEAFTNQHGSSKVSKLKSVGVLQGTY